MCLVYLLKSINTLLNSYSNIYTHIPQMRSHTIAFLSRLTSSSCALYDSSSSCTASATIGNGLKKNKRNFTGIIKCDSSTLMHNSDDIKSKQSRKIR